ncbi:hypothetical protein Ddye_029182 [Dipteronia dyeriana]|uniref:Uncharacterized protein n=1 Tax=Dipteronia dyeriana TaxID=168575 RepID=A0AAD9TF79_9ROSI|nr:hypothetical protein Ddye_029182 [Dipteronia dyeriana]
MSKLANLKFDALKVSGYNYMSWVIDDTLYLKSQGLYYTIDNGINANEQDRTATMDIIHHHLNEDLKAQYLTVTDSEDLWQELQDRYDHQHDVTLPNARSYSIGSTELPEVNANTIKNRNRGRGRGRGRGGGHRNGRNLDRVHGYGRNLGWGHGRSFKRGCGYSRSGGYNLNTP